MARSSILLGSVVLFALCFALVVNAQTCDPPAVTIKNDADIIFTPQQEMDLGDIILEKVRSDYGIIDDPAVTYYLQKMAARLAAHLPNKGIAFRIFVSDQPDTNALTITGGVIVITRKMVSFARTEDELAFILAHEMGHATVRHGAITYSRMFKRILNVDKFKDRKDIEEKFNELLERRYTKYVKPDDTDEEQDEADRLGVYAVAAAGYDAAQIAPFWQRLTSAKKKSAISIFLGGSTGSEKRLKEIVDQYKNLPAGCRENRGSTHAEEFAQWRTRVVSFDPFAKVESVPGIIKRTTLSPIRSEILAIKFSRDGRYLLVQDAATVTVLRREPLEVLFQAPAEDSLPADFTPDSSSVIVVTNGLHLRKWDVGKRELSDDIEIALPNPAWQTRVSPNGELIAAFEYNGDLSVYDTKTSDLKFRKKEYYLPTSFGWLLWQASRQLDDGFEKNVISLKFSPDSAYLLAGGEAQIGFLAHLESIVVDLTTNKQISTGGNVDRLIKNSYTFLSKDRMIGRVGKDMADSGIFSFPSGERLEKFELGGLAYSKAAEGDLIAVRPVNGAAVGIFDIHQKKYIFASRKWALDVYKDIVAAERKNGEIALYKIGSSEPFATADLPKSDFGRLRTVSFSDDGTLLVASNRGRGAVWSLENGNTLMELRSFRGSFITPDDTIFADFPAKDEMQRTIAKIEPAAKAVTPGSGFVEDSAQQYGKFLLIRRSLDEDFKKDQAKFQAKNPLIYSDERRDRAVSFRKVEFEVRDVTTGKTLWSRKFLKETPYFFVNSSRDTIALMWDAKADAVNELIEAKPDLASRRKALKEKAGDQVVEFVDLATGVAKYYLFLETGEYSIQIDAVRAAGDYIVVDDSENRQLVFSAKTGELIRRFVGVDAILNAPKGMILIENLPGRLFLYDIASGKLVNRMTFRKNVSAMRFSRDGERLFILTTDQISYTVDVSHRAP
ncbi:MAG: peptidase M48, Ste24p [Acidobacteria bacterium OLB17]|nr:MAG: peptidase M48, Ste24p [Acidobacteria bacterium OLB17]MCZ2390284.1 M48 family metalloprotease [Acidobacteriota bacterium]